LSEGAAMAPIPTNFEYECGGLSILGIRALELEGRLAVICGVAEISSQGAAMVSTGTDFEDEPGALLRSGV